MTDLLPTTAFLIREARAGRVAAKHAMHRLGAQLDRAVSTAVVTSELLECAAALSAGVLLSATASGPPERG